MQCSRCLCGCWTWGVVSQGRSSTYTVQDEILWVCLWREEEQLVQSSAGHCRGKQCGQTLQQERTPGTWAIGPRTPSHLFYPRRVFKTKLTIRIFSKTASSSSLGESNLIGLVGKTPSVTWCQRLGRCTPSLSLPSSNLCTVSHSPTLPGSHHLLLPALCPLPRARPSFHSQSTQLSARLVDGSCNCQIAHQWLSSSPFSELTVLSASPLPQCLIISVWVSLSFSVNAQIICLVEFSIYISQSYLFVIIFASSQNVSSGFRGEAKWMILVRSRVADFGVLQYRRCTEGQGLLRKEGPPT